MSAMEVKSMTSFEQAVGPRTCVFFWAAWHEPSKPGGQMDQVFTQLAEVHQGSVTCLKVEAEEVPEISEMLQIAMVPTFVLMKRGKSCGKIEGADPPALVKRIQEFANEAIGGDAEGAGEETGLDPDLKTRIERLIRSSPLILFMKGNAEHPKCKFSRQMVDVLRSNGVQYDLFDILSDEDVRAGLKKLSGFPTFPQLYVNGKLVGGVDDVTKLAKEGDLTEKLQSFGGVAARTASIPAASVRDRCKELVNRARTMLFMKGSPDTPRCGFSRSIVGILRDEGIEFGYFDILEDERVRQDLKQMSNWPTYPQVYVNGELVGGLDIVREMQQEGGLASQLGVESQVDLQKRLKGLVSSRHVMLFMKGTPEAPKCGFSRKAVALLEQEKVEFGTFDILEDPDVRQGLKDMSNWPTYPQLYAGGELLGGLDIMQEMAQENELSAALNP